MKSRRCLIEHPDVVDVAVFGVPDPKLDEAICALVVTRPGASVTGDDLITYVRDRIASYKKPRHVVFVDELPRNASGKVMKPLLRERYESIGVECK